MRLAALVALHAAAPVAFGTIIAATVTVLLQTGLLVNPGALRPDFSRVSPRAGLQRLFGANGAVEALKSCAKIVLMALIAWRVLAGDLAALLASPFADAATLAARCATPILHMLIGVLLAQTVIAAADLLWVRVRHARTMRMSRQDVRDEQKETEGDPKVRMRFRQLRLRRARKRMLAAVPKATVVIVNPTHYAVALLYDRARNAAPRVVAKGVELDGRTHPRGGASQPGPADHQPTARARAASSRARHRHPGGTLQGGGRDHRLCLAPRPPRPPKCTAAMNPADTNHAGPRSEADPEHERRLRVIGQLAGGIAHDFNNLLTAILGAADAILDRPATPAETAADARQIRRGVERGAALVRQLLAFSRQQTLLPRIVAVNAAIEDAAQLLRRLLGARIALTIELEQPGRRVKVDPGTARPGAA